MRDLSRGLESPFNSVNPNESKVDQNLAVTAGFPFHKNGKATPFEVRAWAAQEHKLNADVTPVREKGGEEKTLYWYYEIKELDTGEVISIRSGFQLGIDAHYEVANEVLRVIITRKMWSDKFNQ
jgi:hypothetical protein